MSWNHWLVISYKILSDQQKKTFVKWDVYLVTNSTITNTICNNFTYHSYNRAQPPAMNTLNSWLMAEWRDIHEKTAPKYSVAIKWCHYIYGSFIWDRFFFVKNKYFWKTNKICQVMLFLFRAKWTNPITKVSRIC